MLWSSGEHRNVLIPTSQLHSVWPVLEAAILLKATLPAGTQMPLFQMTPKDGGEPVTLSQSRAILRFVGSATYDGKSLYPEDPQERYWCDEVREKERQTGN